MPRKKVVVSPYSPLRRKPKVLKPARKVASPRRYKDPETDPPEPEIKIKPPQSEAAKAKWRYPKAWDDLPTEERLELIRERRRVQVNHDPATQTDEEREKIMQVRMMASTKTSYQAMADMLGIGVQRLKRDYRTELTRGSDYVYAAISQKLVGTALAGDLRSQLAWLRKFGGWEEVQRKEITGQNGEPISIRSLDGPSLIALVESLRPQSIAGRSGSRAKATIEHSPDVAIDLDAFSGSAGEGEEESS